MNPKALLLAFLCFAAVGLVVVAPLLHNACSQIFTVRNNSFASYNVFVQKCQPLGDPIDTPVPK